MGNKKRMIVLQLYTNPERGSQGSVLAAWRQGLGEPRSPELALQAGAGQGCGKQSKQTGQIETGPRETRAGHGEEAGLDFWLRRYVCFKILSCYENSQFQMVRDGKPLL